MCIVDANGNIACEGKIGSEPEDLIAGQAAGVAVAPTTRTLDWSTYPQTPSGGSQRADPGQKRDPGGRMLVSEERD